MRKILLSSIATLTSAILCYQSLYAQDIHAQFKSWDKNDDGFVSQDEFPAGIPKAVFTQVDSDGDGRLSAEEDLAYRNRNRVRSNGPKLPANIKAIKDVTYETVGDRKLPLDIYVPREATTPTPLIVWIHGGGWKGGSKKGINRVAVALQHGYAVASVEYRLSGEAKFPAAIEDCKAAISFLRLHAQKYNLAPDRIGVWGSSAGGHLVALLGVTNDSDVFDTHPVCEQASSEVQAVCNWFGPTDFLRMNDFPSKIDHDAENSPESLFIGRKIQDAPQEVAKANPITYVSPGDPPMLLMHGEKDMSVPFNQSKLLFNALQKAKVQSELFNVRGADHGFRGARETQEELAMMAVKFFDRHLK